MKIVYNNINTNINAGQPNSPMNHYNPRAAQNFKKNATSLIQVNKP